MEPNGIRSPHAMIEPVGSLDDGSEVAGASLSGIGIPERSGEIAEDGSIGLENDFVDDEFAIIPSEASPQPGLISSRSASPAPRSLSSR